MGKSTKALTVIIVTEAKAPIKPFLTLTHDPVRVGLKLHIPTWQVSARLTHKCSRRIVGWIVIFVPEEGIDRHRIAILILHQEVASRLLRVKGLRPSLLGIIGRHEKCLEV